MTKTKDCLAGMGWGDFTQLWGVGRDKGVHL